MTPQTPRDAKHRLWPEFGRVQATEPVRVLLVVDEPGLRQVLAQELLADPRVLLTAQTGSTREARRFIGTASFDVLVADIDFDGEQGLELIAATRARRPIAEIIAMSSSEEPEDALRAMRLGATGYLTKSSWFRDIADAVLQVANGGAAISPSVTRQLLGVALGGKT
ncbi:response regulator [Variovorax paradoxus]|uniref:response regulator n=1 Tax=Variovorax paradoxus TaxID=34073 RepID=UPI0019340648|nr:response regulator transcription factor [Variovorax paradoxus]